MMTAEAPACAMGELERQARMARLMGSPFIADILEANQRQIGYAPQTAALIDTWPHDPSASALAMRFNAALHAVARRGSQPRLNGLYRREHEDFDGAIAAALTAEDGFIAEWMLDTPQTNEVGRAGAIVAALLVAAEARAMPFELLELGSSCGLNLNLAHYDYDLGGRRAGNPQSSVKIAPEWHGACPPAADVDIVSARGIDLNPLDAGNEATRERLLSYVWADQPLRAHRLEQALLMARDYPPHVTKGDAVAWLASRLNQAQQPGVCRVILHSMVVQYFPECQQLLLNKIIAAAGRLATAERPLARIEFEWTPSRHEVQLNLTLWPSDERRLLAVCHPYGNWIIWK